MRAVVTVTGKDKKGIIAKVSAFLAERNVNIEDISQTILQDYFAMIMLVDIGNITMELADLAHDRIVNGLCRIFRLFADARKQ